MQPFFQAMNFHLDSMRALGTLAVVLGLSGCAGWSPDGPAAPTALAAPTAWEQAGRTPASASLNDGSSAWTHQTFPGKRKNRYRDVWREGRPAMAVQSDAAISAMRKVVQTHSGPVTGIRFSWKLSALLQQADLRDSARSDSPVRIVLTFDGDRSRLSAKDAMLSELARSLTGEEMPYATLMYVWSNELPVGTVVHSRRTDRIRKMVIESGPAGLNRWLDYERDIEADFMRAFGELPSRLTGVAIMTDTDNTGGSARAWYGPVALRRSP